MKAFCKILSFTNIDTRNLMWLYALLIHHQIATKIVDIYVNTFFYRNT